MSILGGRSYSEGSNEIQTEEKALILNRTLLATAIAMAMVGGCAAPQYMSQTVDADTVSRAGNEIRRSVIPGPRTISDEDAETTVRTIYTRLLPGATQVCQEMGEHSCNWDIRYSPDNDVNAFAAGQGTILIKKGILLNAENDDEVAMVVAHEMSHHAANHISESVQNATTGAVVGAVLMGALAGAAYGGGGYSPAYTQYQVSDAVSSGMQAGAAIGHVGYSKAQENEADYLAAHILHRGGYDLAKARGMWVKLGRLGTTEHGERHSFTTHPDPAERLARWDATVAEFRARPSGVSQPIKRSTGHSVDSGNAFGS